MTSLDPASRSFRFIILPICIAYFLICVLLGGWPFNLILPGFLFNGRVALLLIAICILHSRNGFENITREHLIEGLGLLVILGIAANLLLYKIGDLEFLGPTQDEPLLVEPVMRMLETGTYDFQNYEYGGVYFYVLAIAFVMKMFHGAPHARFHTIADFPETNFYTVGRVVTVLFNLATIATVFAFARKYFGRLPAFAAALILTFSGLIYTISHQVRLDFALAFFVLLAHWFFLRILDEPSSLNYTFAGIFCGLAIGTKYTVAPIFISLLVAHALAKKDRWLNWNVIVGLFVGMAVYVITNLYAFIHLAVFVDRLATAIYHNLNPSHWSSVSNRALEHTRLLAYDGIGIVALLAALITIPRIFSRPTPGVAGAGCERRASDRLLILWTFPFLHLLLIGSYPSGFPRYLLPTLPLLSILAGEGIRIGLDWLKARNQTAQRFSKFLVPVALVLLLVQPVWGAIQFYSEMSKVLPPKDVIDWVQKNIPAGAKILADPTGPLIPDDRYKVTTLTYDEFRFVRNVRGYDYVCVTEDLFFRIPDSYEVLHEFPSRTKALDRSVRIYKARE
jgi:4-amino-4-deoxy-L-arabinose transferase-like glycosyltransferase